MVAGRRGTEARGWGAVVKFWTRVRRFTKHVILRQPRRKSRGDISEWVARYERRQAATVPRKKPIYTGRDSGSRMAILTILSNGEPRTRKEIEAQMTTKTARIHLPRMVEDGLIVSFPRDPQGHSRSTRLYQLAAAARKVEA